MAEERRCARKGCELPDGWRNRNCPACQAELKRNQKAYLKRQSQKRRAKSQYDAKRAERQAWDRVESFADLTPVELGVLIKARRLGLGKGLTATAKEAGVSPAYLCNIEAGTKEPLWPVLWRVLKAVQVAPILMRYEEKEAE